MVKPLDRRKSLQQLEQLDWGEPTYDSHVVKTCHRLRRKPLDEFTVEDLHIMIGQNISLPHLIPIALERLEVDPLAEGDCFAGDLLSVVLKVDDHFWPPRPDLIGRIRKIVGQVKASLPELDELDQETVRWILMDGNSSLTE